jgi:hypothetical protein
MKIIIKIKNFVTMALTFYSEARRSDLTMNRRKAKPGEANFKNVSAYGK